MPPEQSGHPPHIRDLTPRPSEEAVRQHLAKILASPEFQRSVLLRNFLRFIV